MGSKLQILVENQGRINYGIANDFKGILGNVYFNKLPLLNWTITGFPLEDGIQVENMIRSSIYRDVREEPIISANSQYLQNGPAIFYANFNILSNEIHDTYIDPTGWGKVSLISNLK